MISSTRSNSRRLRVGILLESLVVPAWMAKVVRDVGTAEFVDLELVALVRRRRRWKAAISQAWLGAPSTVLFRLYRWVDHALFRLRKDASSKVRLGVANFDRSPVRVECEEAGPVEVIRSDDVDVIRESKLDVLLHLGVGRIGGDVLHCARQGVWSVGFDGQPGTPLDAAFFRELAAGNPVSRTTLSVLGDAPNDDTVIYRSFAKTNLASLCRTQSPIFWKTADFVIRRLKDLHCGGWRELSSNSDRQPEFTTGEGRGRLPGNVQTARFLFRLMGRALARGVSQVLTRDQWTIAICKRNRDGSDRRVEVCRILRPATDRFYADPFLFEKNGTEYLFFEDFSQKTGKGVISCVEIQCDGSCGPPHTVLKTDCHLSYPFVFEWNNEVFLLPETSGDRTIRLYSAVDFPYRWRLEKVLLSGLAAVDATLIPYEGKFWMFTNVRVDGGSSMDELCIFYGDSPLGPWHPHPGNPVVSDVRRARPAGRLFFEDGRLIRPAQDCSVSYGHAITFHRVDVLSETDYREVPVRRFEPNGLFGNLATHTYNRSENFEVFDCKFCVCKRWNAFWRIGQLFDRRLQLEPRRAEKLASRITTRDQLVTAECPVRESVLGNVAVPKR